MTFKAGYTGGSSAGKLELESESAFTPTVQANGLDGSASHQMGFAINSASDPIRHDAFVVPVAIADAISNPKTLAGLTAARSYSLQLQLTQFNQIITARWQAEHLLNTPSVRYAAFGLWSTVQDDFQGSLSGRPTWWGGYAYGSPSLGSELASMGSKQFSGLAGAHWLFPDSLRLNSQYGAVTVSFDSARRVAQVTLTLTHTAAINYVLTFPRSYTEDDGLFNPGVDVASAPLSCDAPVDMNSGIFACDLPSVAGGAVRGRFYGPNGDEVAGVFSRWDWSGASTNWGVVGGFVAKVTTSTGQRSVVRKTVR